MSLQVFTYKVPLSTFEANHVRKIPSSPCLHNFTVCNPEPGSLGTRLVRCYWHDFIKMYMASMNNSHENDSLCFQAFSFLTGFLSLVVRKSRYCYSQFLLCSNVAFCVHCSVMKFMALALIFQWRIFNALAHTKHNVTILQSTWNRLELKLDGPGKQGFIFCFDIWYG